jgi:hypothetical protein
MTKRVKNADQPWVVYAHYDADGVVYIGSGQVHRAFQFTKRSEEHYDWFVEHATKNLTGDFIKILFVTEERPEALFVEGRLMAEFKPKFNIHMSKVTRKELAQTILWMSDGKSLRSCASSIGIAHDNLRILLKQKYCNNDYTGLYL